MYSLFIAVHALRLSCCVVIGWQHRAITNGLHLLQAIQWVQQRKNTSTGATLISVIQLGDTITRLAPSDAEDFVCIFNSRSVFVCRSIGWMRRCTPTTHLPDGLFLPHVLPTSDSGTCRTACSSTRTNQKHWSSDLDDLNGTPATCCDINRIVCHCRRGRSAARQWN